MMKEHQSNNNNSSSTSSSHHQTRRNQSLLRFVVTLILVWSPSYSRALEFHDFFSSSAAATAEAEATPSQVLIASSAEEAASFTNNMQFSFEKALPHSHHRSLGSASSLNCSCPDTIYYKAKVDLNTYTQAECSLNELEWIGHRIHYHWDQYSAFSQEVGPIDIILSPTVCSGDTSSNVTRRQRKLQFGGDDNDGDGYDSNTITFGGGQHHNQAEQGRRQLFSFGYPYRFAAQCYLCRVDNRDKRRSLSSSMNGLRGAASATGGEIVDPSALLSPEQQNLQQKFIQKSQNNRRQEEAEAPHSRHLLAGDDGLITISVKTDEYPDETGYQIVDKDGNVVVSVPTKTYTEKHTHFPEEYVLTQDAEYTLQLLDSYGDGWCCGFGSGHALIIDSITDEVLYNMTGDFTVMSEQKFKVPLNNQTSSRSFADLIFTELEPYLSTYISFYIQQEFHNNVTSCLNMTHPYLWIELEETDEAGALNPCT